MAYCTTEDVKRILPESVTVGDNNIGTPVPGRPGGTQRSLIDPGDITYYIDYAQQDIDARLRNMYICPLRRLKTYEVDTEGDINAGVNVTVTVRDTGAFMKGQLIRLQDKYGYENTTIGSITDLTTMVVTTVVGNYATVDTSKISILEFPDPLPLISARMVCSFLMDKLFNAEQEPAVSDYSKEQRSMAEGVMESILSGEIVLVGQEYTGWRFLRSTLLTSYRSHSDFESRRERS